MRQLAARRLALACLAVICVALTVPATAANAATHTPSKITRREAATRATLNRFVALFQAGAGGTFSTTYSVAGGSTGTLSLAQRAPSRRSPFPDTDGTWSYRLDATSGESRQWIESGSKVWDCWHAQGVTRWSCSGPGSYQTVSNYLQAVDFYIPGQTLQQLEDLLDLVSLEPKYLHDIRFSTATSKRFGRLDCIRLAAAVAGQALTGCIDHQGVLVNEQNGLQWRSLSLLSHSSKVPAGAFGLLGPSRSSGAAFTVIPF